MKGGYFEELKFKTCLSDFTLSLLHNSACFQTQLMPSVRNCKVSNYEKERKDINLIGCVQTFDWWWCAHTHSLSLSGSVSSETQHGLAESCSQNSVAPSGSCGSRGLGKKSNNGGAHESRQNSQSAVPACGGRRQPRGGALHHSLHTFGSPPQNYVSGENSLSIFTVDAGPQAERFIVWLVHSASL